MHEQEFLHFLNLLPDDKLLLDLGANIGIMTVPLAKKASNGQVYSFEPMPQNIKALKRIIKHYKLTNVTVFEYALGAGSGTIKMLMPIINAVKMQGLCHMIDDDNTEEGERFTVPLMALDNMPELQNAKAIGGIKIDVENFEYEVLTGARNLLLKHKPLIYCELWNNEKRKLTLDYLRDEIGYTIRIYDGEKLIPYTGQNALNYFMIP